MVMFGSVFRDKEKCKELLERILGLTISELTIVEAQKTMKSTFLGKGIRIDVYAKDMEGNAYDIEMKMDESFEDGKKIGQRRKSIIYGDSCTLQ